MATGHIRLTEAAVAPIEESLICEACRE